MSSKVITITPRTSAHLKLLYKKNKAIYKPHLFNEQKAPKITYWLKKSVVYAVDSTSIGGFMARPRKEQVSMHDTPYYHI